MSKLRLLSTVALLLLATAAFADDTRAFLMAARNGDLAEVERLVESGVPVNANGEWGITALALASRAGALEVIEYLL